MEPKFYYMTLSPAGEDASTAVLTMRVNLHELPDKPWKFLGWEKTTKRAVVASREEWLSWINTVYGVRFERLLVD